jgi:hypothetical protein
MYTTEIELQRCRHAVALRPNKDEDFSGGLEFGGRTREYAGCVVWLSDWSLHC